MRYDNSTQSGSGREDNSSKPGGWNTLLTREGGQLPPNSQTRMDTSLICDI